MRYHAHNEIARGFPGSQHRFTDRFGYLDFVAHVFLALLAVAFAGVGRLRLMRILDALGAELFFGPGLGRCRIRQFKLLAKDPPQ